MDWCFRLVLRLRILSMSFPLSHDKLRLSKWFPWFHTDGLVSVSSAVDEASIPFQNLPMSGRCGFVFPEFQHAFDEKYVIHYIDICLDMHLDCFPHDLIGSYRSCFLAGTVSSLLKVLKMCWKIAFCCETWTTHPAAESLFAQPSLAPSFAIPRLGCSWHVCMCACAHVFMKGKTTLWWNATWTTRIVLAHLSNC